MKTNKGATLRSAQKLVTGPSWRRVAWNSLPKGQEVRLSENGKNISYGVVDGSTPDGRIIWVVLDRWGERRMFHKSDCVDVEIPR